MRCGTSYPSVSLFIALQDRAYPTNTRERGDKYALACEERLRSLADLGYVDSVDLARKYLDALPWWVQGSPKKEMARSRTM